MSKDLGIIETHYITIAQPPREHTLESGEKLGPITIAYETYGTLNKDKSNAVLILHAFTGDAHAAGFHKGDKKPGWWNDMIGPDRAFNTKKYFVICSNILAGCGGTTGPSSIHPKTKKPYALDFPIVTIGDMVAIQRHLIDHLGIPKLLSVAGGSMGGMQALQWLTAYPDTINSSIIIATTTKHSPQQIAFDEVGRQAIMADPNWNNGNYYDKKAPAGGLSVARMIGHITYMSNASMQDKFGRKTRTSTPKNQFNSGFEVENYLHYRGNSFVNRFDANSYLYITKAMDSFDVSQGQALHELLKGLKPRVLVVSFKSDWLYPAYQSREIVRACKLAGVDTTYVDVNSNYGHDAFLLEVKEQTHLIKHFLEKVTKNGKTA